MKKTLVLLFAASLAVPALALTNKDSDSPPLALSGKTRGTLRTWVQTAVRHLLNFGHETPLNEAQRSQVSSVIEKYRPQVHDLMERGRDTRRGFEEVVKKEGPESARARQSAEGVADVARDRALLMAKIGSEIRPLLTPAQQQHLEEMRTELRALMDSALAANNL